MITETINGIRRIKAAPGMFLTKDGSIGTEVWLGINDTESGWVEVSEPMDEDAMLDELEVLLSE